MFAQTIDRDDILARYRAATRAGWLRRLIDRARVRLAAARLRSSADAGSLATTAAARWLVLAVPGLTWADAVRLVTGIVAEYGDARLNGDIILARYHGWGDALTCHRAVERYEARKLARRLGRAYRHGEHPLADAASYLMTERPSLTWPEAVSLAAGVLGVHENTPESATC